MTCWEPFKLSSGPFNFEPELEPRKQILEMYYFQIALSSSFSLSSIFPQPKLFIFNLFAYAKISSIIFPYTSSKNFS